MYGYKAYKTTQLKTADSKEMILHLYEAALSHLRDAVSLINSPDTQLGSFKAGKTLKIVNLLRGTLDFGRGGEIAVNLASLYDYLRDIINQGIISKDASKFEEAISLMSTLFEGWKPVLKRQDTTEEMYPDHVATEDRPAI